MILYVHIQKEHDAPVPIYYNTHINFKNDPFREI